MKITKELHDKLQTMAHALLIGGKEHFNPTPLAIPAGYERPPSLQEQIKRVMREEVSHQAQLQGAESWDEANDFDWPDDDEPISGYEVREMVDEEPTLSTDPERSDPAPAGTDDDQEGAADTKPEAGAPQVDNG